MNLASNHDYNHGNIVRIYWIYKQGAVAPKRAWGPPIFVSKFKFSPIIQSGRRGGLMVSAVDSRSGGPGSSPGSSTWPGHCVVFLGKILYFHSVSLHPGV